MKKLFLIGVFAFGLLSVPFSNANANINETYVYTESDILDNDGWENVGKAIAEAWHGPAENKPKYYEGTLYVKIIASKVLFKFVCLGKEYNVHSMGGNPGNYHGFVTFGLTEYKINLPFIDA